MNNDLNDAIKALRAAEEAYESARSEASFARGRETDALNRLNAAQKAADKAMDAVRNSSPVGSDWKSGRVTRHVEV